VGDAGEKVKTLDYRPFRANAARLKRLLRCLRGKAGRRKAALQMASPMADKNRPLGIGTLVTEEEVNAARGPFDGHQLLLTILWEACVRHKDKVRSDVALEIMLDHATRQDYISPRRAS